MVGAASGAFGRAADPRRIDRAFQTDARETRAS
jgi:hypothetical protein